MIIDKNSAHFKFVDFFYETKAYDLCTYIRRLLILSVCMFIVMLLLFCFYAALGALFFSVIGSIQFSDSLVLSFLAGIPVSAFIVFMCIIVYDMWNSGLALNETEKITLKEPTMISTYIKSKAENYCVKIEYKD